MGAVNQRAPRVDDSAYQHAADQRAADQRARTHAALADPHRLAIVDALALGDETPGVLAQRLDITTNLMAHHLAVLEAAGIVERHRSEGDRRRSYVSLVWHNPIVSATVLPPPPLPAARVVFVCTQNSARSHMAASLFADACAVPATSGGTHPAPEIHPLAVEALNGIGLSPLSERPLLITDVAGADDLVISVCDRAYEDLISSHPPMLHWSVTDPAATGTPTAFAQALATITRRVKHLAASFEQRSTS